MSLPINLRYRPMEAQPATALPKGPQWQYEPKWDGFRCLAFRDRKRIELASKAGKPLTRYFPELVNALANLSARQFVLDGEIVIPVDRGLSFDHLLMRIHPAASRILKYARPLERRTALREHNCYGMRWEVLHWNTPAIEFYRSLGAKMQNEWWPVIFMGSAFEDFATQERAG